jgi:hypothetical protein
MAARHVQTQSKLLFIVQSYTLALASKTSTSWVLNDQTAAYK